MKPNTSNDIVSFKYYYKHTLNAHFIALCIEKLICCPVTEIVYDEENGVYPVELCFNISMYTDPDERNIVLEYIRGIKELSMRMIAEYNF